MVSSYLSEVVHYFFYAYTILLFLRVISSWIPHWQDRTFFRFVAFLTDPYLNIFRRILPPLGGTLDISPLLAFFVLTILERIILFLLSY